MSFSVHAETFLSRHSVLKCCSKNIRWFVLNFTGILLSTSQQVRVSGKQIMAVFDEHFWELKTLSRYGRIYYCIYLFDIHEVCESDQ
jgi:hypothetical protein